MLCVLVLLLTLFGSALECLGVSIIIPVMGVLMEPEHFLDSRIVRVFPFLQKVDRNGLIFLIMGSV